MSILNKFNLFKRPGSVTSGKVGEDVAVEYLKRKGYAILLRNYQVCGAEIDIVASKGEYLCFVEVKTRSGDYAGMPVEYVNMKKQERYIRGAKVISSRVKFRSYYIRFDVISVILKNSDIKVDHLEDAFGEDG